MSHGPLRSVDNLNLCVSQGSILALLGPSGCGKTTTLRLIAGLERPEQGEIFLFGKKMSTPKKVIPPFQRSIALVFQDLALWPHMTVREHLAFVLGRRLKNKAKLDRITELLELIHLNKPERYPRQLSGGEQQRLALARALAQDPNILLLDEPFSNLDVALKDSLLQEMKTILARLGITVVYVTHCMDEAIALADQVATMKQGRLVQYRSAREFFKKQTQATKSGTVLRPAAQK